MAHLLGTQRAGITLGNRPILGDISVSLEDGDRITRTQSATVLEDLINQFIYSKAAEGKEGSE